MSKRLCASALRAISWVALLVWVGGCTTVDFPEQAIRLNESPGGKRFAYDLDGDGTVDYVETADASGAIVKLERFMGAGSAEHWSVDLDKVDQADARHLLIIVDGLPFRVVEHYREQGGLRFFRRPQRMIAPFPSMTDPALAEIFHSAEPVGYEVSYYNRERRRLSSILDVYFDVENADWNHYVDHRLSFLMDGVMYVYPRWVFRKEIRDLQTNFRNSPKKVFVAYLSSTAGVGTDEGEPGYWYILDYLDRLTHRLMMEHKGKLIVTLLSDHGHTLIPPLNANLEETLRGAGFRFTERLKRPKDAAMSRFGLVNYASIWTDSPVQLAAAGLQNPAVTQAFYIENGRVIVRDRLGVARIHQRGERYRYDSSGGDPLKLASIIEKMSGEGKVDSAGYVDDRALFDATVTHEYPDALRRVWRAFHGIAKNPPDVIFALRDDRWEGREGLAGWTHLRSTHGSLGRESATAVVVSTGGEIPGPIRTADFRKALKRMLPDHAVIGPASTDVPANGNGIQE